MVLKSCRIAAAAAALIAVAALQARSEERHLIGNVGVIAKNADRFEARLGVASYDTGIFSHKDYDGVVINGELLFPSPEFLYGIGSPRPYIGTDIGIAKDPVHFFYSGLNWETYFTDRISLSGSLGGAVHTADDLDRTFKQKALGCRVLFHLGVAAGFDLTPDLTTQLYADHFSNADLCDPNNGQESAGVRFGYRF